MFVFKNKSRNVVRKMKKKMNKRNEKNSDTMIIKKVIREIN